MVELAFQVFLAVGDNTFQYFHTLAQIPFQALDALVHGLQLLGGLLAAR